MKKTLLASLALLLGWGGTAFAQTGTDALRYSQLGISGTARIQGIGGAQTALGADITNIAGNPAGLGMFRRSEFSITPGIQYNTTETGTGDGNFTDERNIFSVPQMGLVLSKRRGDDDTNDWRGVNLGIGFTRLNNFNQQLRYTNTTEAPNTIVDYFADQANINGRTESSLIDEVDNTGITSLAGLAYSTFLIEFWDVERGEATNYANPLYSYGAIGQLEEIQRRGSQNQLDIGVGTSYKDKIYLGASLGIITSNFTQESIFRESGDYVIAFDEENQGIPGQYNLTLRDEFTTRGAGINLKVGVIARPVDALRLGLSIQTPTAYNFTDDYQRSLSATSVDPDTGVPGTYSDAELPGEFNYRLTTPFRATGGVAYFIGKYGFITADAEFVNYGGMRFSEDNEFGSSSGYFTDVNNSISDTYQSAVNFKIGAEGRYEAFRFRAGYAHSGDPYKSNDLDGSIKAYTLGAGIRLQNYFVDLAYVNSNQATRYSPYTFSSGGGEPIVDMKNRQSTALLTVGFNF
ncbi:OmpP1/FadL family transporter [Pontibacter rugosus]|uniref:OmpP1/FadL family transporter n=1 Tax=Pontibacter rugosus TaxID=1745966 RepID=A0ABW3SL82_9BACT